MNIALILSGGSGKRVGTEIPKQYLKVQGKMVITYSLRTLIEHDWIDAIQIVAELSWQEVILEQLTLLNVNANKILGFSQPGENRQLSILHGLQDIRKYANGDDFVIIHDAARPMLSKKQITDCFNGAWGHDGAMPVLPMKDTVYLSNNGLSVSELIDRSSIFAGQAPEVFRLNKYYEANLNLLPDQILRINGSTEPAILMGLDVVMVPGEENNFKITTLNDLKRFQDIIKMEG